MTGTKIKICGIATATALDAAVAARASHIGFNFYPPSPRCVSLANVADLGARAAGKALRVGVFVNPEYDDLGAAVATGALDAVQFHGGESPQVLARAKAAFGLPVWKVLSVASAADLQHAAAFVGVADFLLLDAKTPKGSLPGGLGLRFDWGLLRGWRAPLPWGLAGGLNPGNVGDAVRQTGAGLVDTASGVESTPGIKDPALIAAFCDAVRSA